MSLRPNAAASALEHPSSGVSRLPPTGTLQQAYLHAGHMVISREPCRVTTVLGSCVAVGLWDPTSGIGGVNHFLLPHGSDPESARFGNAAVRTLIREVVAAGARRRSLQAKLFGGACVLRAFRGFGTGSHLGQKNVEVARQILLDEGIPVAGAELLQIFTAESEENLRDMEVSFVQLESAPQDEETLQAIFRAAHTIKGNAAGLGFPALAKFAHGVEDVLDGLRTGAMVLTTPLATILLQTVDALRQLVAAAVKGADGLLPEHLELLEDLMVEGGGGQNSGVEQSESKKERRGGQSRRRADQSGGMRAQTLRVEIEKLDRMLNLTGEIAVARERLAGLLEETDHAKQLEDILEAHRAADRLFMDLQEEVMKIRMVPLGPTFRQFVRTVRDIATAQGKLAYVHFRNVRGKVPFYKETFLDDGDIDMLRVLRILKTNGFGGVLIPDHTPQMSCDAPWHAGMAFALGYMRSALRALSAED